MTEVVTLERSAEADRVVRIYAIVAGLMLFGIAVLSVYIYKLGPLVGPGVESSFGYAAGLLFLMGALLIHLVDRTYRVYPLGRRVTPPYPAMVTDRSVANFLRAVVIFAAIASIAYILGSLIGT